MSAPSYSQVPPSDFQTINTSYPPPQAYQPPQQPNEKTQFTPGVQEYSPPQDDLLTSATPQTATKRGLFRLRTLAHKFWLLEAFASVLSLAMFGAIIGVLVWYHNTEYGSASNGQQNPTKRPTIFPVLALLGVIMRAAMLLPVATAIGQLKWGWFRTGRRLLDMERFDEAARGILGSAKLIWTLKFKNVATVGAALTILALPLDALIQSSVLIPSKFVVNELAYDRYPNITDKTTMPRSTWYNESQIMETVDRLYPETSLINALRFGQSYSNGLSDLFTTVTNVGCPTGTCYFPKAQTLAIDSNCVDRTKDIVTHPAKGNTAAYQSLTGTNLTFYYDGAKGFDSQIIATQSYPDYEDNKYMNDMFGPGFLGLIVRTAMMMSGPDNDTLAYECALSWTVRTSEEYVNATSDYQLNATVESVAFDIAYQPNDEFWWLMEPERCYVQGQVMPKSNDSNDYKDNCLFGVGTGPGKALETMLLDKEDGFMGDSYVISPKNFTRMNPFITNVEAARNHDTPALVFEAIQVMWGNIAFLSSFTVRHAQSYLVNETFQYLTTEGTVYRGIYYYSIDWPRLGLPAFVVAFAAFFVLYTAITTRKEYAWRRSALPLLFHGIEDRERVALGDVRSFLTMQDVAEKLHVKLEEHVDANGARFTTQHEG